MTERLILSTFEELVERTPLGLVRNELRRLAFIRRSSHHSFIDVPEMPGHAACERMCGVNRYRYREDEHYVVEFSLHGEETGIECPPCMPLFDDAHPSSATRALAFNNASHAGDFDIDEGEDL